METSDLDLLAKLRAALHPKKKPPAGFRSVAELAIAWKLSREHTQHLLTKAIFAGLAERIKINPAYFYKIKSKAKKS